MKIENQISSWNFWDYFFRSFSFSNYFFFYCIIIIVLFADFFVEFSGSYTIVELLDWLAFYYDLS